MKIVMSVGSGSKQGLCLKAGLEILHLQTTVFTHMSGLTSRLLT